MASRVRRLIVKPNDSISITAPIREIGMATTGMMTPRTEPRKRKITRMTMNNVSPRVFKTSLMASWM